jgi:hypothetical protein
VRRSAADAIFKILYATDEDFVAVDEAGQPIVGAEA